jgi:serine/threonine protein kinase
MGTPQYLSPEQALGKAVDHRSDLYATGCLLYELLALRPPFTGETPLSVVYQHVQDIPVPPSEVAGAVPPELDGLVMRSLAKDPDDRFQSAEEMRGLVQYGLQMLQVQGGHTGTWNTGPVAMHEGGHTPAMGMAGGTMAMGHPQHGDTSQGPILPPMNPDDGGYDGGHGGDGGRGKLWLFVVLALIAIGAGVAIAVNAANTGGNNHKKTPTTTSSSPAPTKSSEAPSDEETKVVPPQDETTGGDQQPSWQPSTSPSTAPSKPSEAPSETASPPDTGTTGGTTNEGTTGGETPVPSDTATAPGTPGGGDVGGAAGGNADDGAVGGTPQ